MAVLTKRRTISAAMERRIILWQLADGYFEHVSEPLYERIRLLCGCGCGQPILLDTAVIHEHMTPLCMGGEDTEHNIRIVRKECAARKTYGTKATSHGSDSHAYHKGRRLRKETGQRKWKRKWPPGRKLQSGPFNRERVR